MAKEDKFELPLDDSENEHLNKESLKLDPKFFDPKNNNVDRIYDPKGKGFPKLNRESIEISNKFQEQQELKRGKELAKMRAEAERAMQKFKKEQEKERQKLLRRQHRESQEKLKRQRGESNFDLKQFLNDRGKRTLNSPEAKDSSQNTGGFPNFFPQSIPQTNDQRKLGADQIENNLKYRKQQNHKHYLKSGEELTEIPHDIPQFVEKLDLSDNHITSISDSYTLKNLLDIEYINIAGNQPKDATLDLSWARKLKELDISKNNWDNLVELDLSNTRLKSLPKGVEELKNLQKLILRNTSLTPDSLLKLSKLEKLEAIDLRGNHLKNIPDIIFTLKGLKKLYLSKNNISELPKNLFSLKELEELDLSNNEISVIPEDFLALTNLSEFFIDENPLYSPPLAVARRGINALTNYFEERKSGYTKLLEAKILLVGQGAVGKTSLKKKLLEPRQSIYERKEDRTHGIEITTWKIDCEIRGESQKVTLNMWDFGGQEVYHSTHKFFLTERSLYILMGDTVSDNKDKFKEWLHAISLFGKNAPILVVMNKVDKFPARLNQLDYWKKFPQIKSFHNISVVSNVGIEDLVYKIKEALGSLNHLGGKIPMTWQKAREALEKQEAYYISFNQYIEICSPFGISEDRAEDLLSYLHDIGIVVHIKDEDLLENYIILEPRWATEAIYKVLKPAKRLRFEKNREGHLAKDTLLGIWKDRRNTYNRESRSILLKLMRRYDLCFQLLDSPVYVVPELLPILSRDESMDFTEKYEKAEKKLCFDYQYEFIPKGLISRFICRIHPLIKGEYFWKTGVILHKNETEALVLHEEIEEKISIKIIGKDKKDLLEHIRKEFNIIHEIWKIKNVEEMIPCTCSECQENETPYFHKYSFLQKRLQIQKANNTLCGISGVDIRIEELISGVENTINSEVEYLRALMGKNEIFKVLDILRRGLPKDHVVISLERRYWDLTQKKNTNSINREELEISTNRLFSDILSFLDSLGK